MLGAQASSEQLEKILSYIDIGKQEGAEILTGSKRNMLEGETLRRLLCSAYRLQRQEQHAHLPGRNLRTCRQRHQRSRTKKKPSPSPTTRFTVFLGAGVWTRDMKRAYHFVPRDPDGTRLD